MTLEEQITWFERKWYVRTTYVEPAEMYDRNGYFYVEDDDIPFIFANFNSKRTFYSNYKPFYKDEFINEFKAIAKRVRKERIDDTK